MTEYLATNDAESHTATARTTGHGIDLPLPSRVLFWRARHLRADPFLHHLPFAFWLVEALAPRRIVTIGMGSGVAHFGLAQAVDRLGLVCRCQGFETWDDGVPASLAEHNARNYEEFSRLEAATLPSIAPRIAEGSVDLLVLDKPLDAEAIAALTHDWPAKMSPKGVILIHRPGLLAESSEGRALRDRLYCQYPVIALDQGEGLEAVLCGPRQPDRLRQLAELGADDPDRTGVEAVFTRLGWGHQHEWAAGVEASRARKARDEAAALRQRAEVAEAAEKKLRVAWEARGDQIARLQTRAFDHETALEEKLADAEARAVRAREEAAAKVEELEAALQARLHQIADLTRASDAEREATAGRVAALEEKLSDAEARAMNAGRTRLEAAARVEELEAALQARFREIANLTKSAEDSVQSLEGEREKAQEAARLAEGNFLAISNSTSWRMTGPLRAIVRRLRGD